MPPCVLGMRGGGIGVDSGSGCGGLFLTAHSSPCPLCALFVVFPLSIFISFLSIAPLYMRAFLCVSTFVQAEASFAAVFFSSKSYQRNHKQALI